jgi:hypothetical protein
MNFPLTASPCEGLWKQEAALKKQNEQSAGIICNDCIPPFQRFTIHPNIFFTNISALD